MPISEHILLVSSPARRLGIHTTAALRSESWMSWLAGPRHCAAPRLCGALFQRAGFGYVLVAGAQAQGPSTKPGHCAITAADPPQGTGCGNVDTLEMTRGSRGTLELDSPEGRRLGSSQTRLVPGPGNCARRKYFIDPSFAGPLPFDRCMPGSFPAPSRPWPARSSLGKGRKDNMGSPGAGKSTTPDAL